MPGALLCSCVPLLALTMAPALRLQTRPATTLRSAGPLCAATPTSARDSADPDPLGTFISDAVAALSNGSFVKLTLSGNAAECSAKEESPLARLKRIEGRLVQLGNKGERLQLTLKYQHRDTCTNVPLAKVSENLAGWLQPGSFRRGRLLCTAGDVSLERKKRGVLELRRLKPTAKSAPPRAHDRAKGGAVESDAPFLQALGVVKSDGSPRAGMSAKLRQIEKFVETLAALVKRGVGEAPGDAGTAGAAEGEATQRGAPRPPLRIVDAGCGRGYLTFAAHAYFHAHGWAVQSTGVEMRSDLVKSMNGVAKKLGTSFSDLHFECAQVADYLARLDVEAASDAAPQERQAGVAATQGPEGGLEVLVALHACDTATDDALWCGVSNRARVIVTAPCCHKQVRRQFEAASVAAARGEESAEGASLGGGLAAALRHRIYRERTAEMVTDALRALLLEIAGYDVSVFEFIGGEHTSKNVMIAATRRGRPRGDAEVASLRAQFRELAADFGVESQALAVWLGEHEAPKGAQGRRAASGLGGGENRAQATVRERSEAPLEPPGVAGIQTDATAAPGRAKPTRRQ